MKKAVVTLVRSSYENIHRDVEHLFTSSGWKEPKENGIVIKINLCGLRDPSTGAITHPLFLDAVLGYIRRRLGDIEVYVVESDATSSFPDLFMEWFGFMRILEKWNAKWFNLSKHPTVTKRINGRHFKEIKVSQIFEGRYFLSLSKLKTHTMTKISCSLKNQFGCLPSPRKTQYHPFIDDAIVDANLATRPDFSIVDGIIAMGGTQGPGYGIPIRAGVVVASSEPVALDTVCAKLMGFNPFFISHLRRASMSGVGRTDYVVNEERIENLERDFYFGWFERAVLLSTTKLMRFARRRVPE